MAKQEKPWPSGATDVKFDEIQFIMTDVGNGQTIGKISKNDLKNGLAIESIDLNPSDYPPGSALPTGPLGENRRITNVIPGSYTWNGNTYTVPEGYTGTLFWNGSSWSLTTQELPVPDVSGFTEKGGYEGTAQDLDDRIDDIETSPSKAKDWVAGTYTADQTAVKDGVLYRVKPSVPSTTGEPGVSVDWEPIGKNVEVADDFGNSTEEAATQRLVTSLRDTVNKRIEALSDTTALPLSLGTLVQGAIGTAGEDLIWGSARRTGYMPLETVEGFIIEDFISPNRISCVFAFYTHEQIFIEEGSVIVPSNTNIPRLFLVPPPNAFSYRISAANIGSGAKVFKIDLNTTIQELQATSNTIQNKQSFNDNRFAPILSRNRYNRLDPDNQPGRYINSSGANVQGNGNSGITHFIPIFPGETLVMPQYTNAWGGFSALYDINKNLISAVQSNSITHVQGGAFVRFSTSSHHAQTTSVAYVYEIANPISAYEAYEPKVPSQFLPDVGPDVQKPITMIGDSIAAGIGAALRTALISNGIECFNHAEGGESTLDSGARLGSIPYVVSPFTIPSDLSAVEVDICSAKGYNYSIDPITGLVTEEKGDSRINPFGTLACSISGVSGVLTFTRAPDHQTLQTCTFKRNVAGTAVTLTKPERVMPLEVIKDSHIVCFMGTNGGWKVENDSIGVSANYDDADNLINYYRLIRDYTSPNPFVFLGFYETSITTHLPPAQRKEWWDYFEGGMSREFGSNYINVRKYLMTHGWKDAGNTTLTNDDINAIVNEHRIPLNVRSAPTLGQVHLSENASKAIANEVLKRLFELKVINKYIQIDIE